MNKLQEILSTGCYSPGYSVDLSEGWLFQYMGVEKSESRWIYINAISTLFYPDVKDNGFLQNFYSEIQLISDAGRGSWGVLFDLDSHEFADLQFNDSR